MPDWNERYRKGEHANDPPHPVLVEFAASLTPGFALDLACGTGRHTLWIAQHGWRVIAVDNSHVALELLQERARSRGLNVETVLADLERHEFEISPEAYDLIVVCNYLQRDLFGSIREGARVGGMVIAIIAMADDNPNLKPMNPNYLLQPGELRAGFHNWELLHDVEGTWSLDCRGRKIAQLVARKRFQG